MGDPPGRRRPRPVPARSAGRWLAADPGTRPRWRWRNGPGNSWDRWPNRGRWFDAGRRAPRRAGGGARAGAAGPRRRRAAGPGQRLERTRRRRAGWPTTPPAGEVRILRLVDGSEVELTHRAPSMSPTTAASDGCAARRQRDLPRRPTRPGDPALRGKAPAAALSRAGHSVPWSAATTTAASRSGCSNTASRWPWRIRARGPSGAASWARESLRSAERRRGAAGRSPRRPDQLAARPAGSTSSRWARWWRASIATGRGICWWLPVRWRSASAGIPGRRPGGLVAVDQR